MAKAGRSKSASRMSYFSKASTFSVSNPLHSPGRRSDRGFSGPINVSIIPKDVQHKKRSNSGDGAEPTSPKISCMGQIKDKKKKKKKKKKKEEEEEEKQTEKPRRRLCSSCFKGLFRRKVRPGDKEVEEKMEKKRVPAMASAAAPRLGQMRRYQSGRETLAGFDWRKTMRENYGDEGEEEEDGDEAFIPHSAPILVGGGAVAVEPKKEVNLWRRRDMAPPLPIQIQKN